jgi:hypothetical protein
VLGVLLFAVALKALTLREVEAVGRLLKGKKTMQSPKK